MGKPYFTTFSPSRWGSGQPYVHVQWPGVTSPTGCRRSLPSLRLNLPARRQRYPANGFDVWVYQPQTALVQFNGEVVTRIVKADVSPFRPAAGYPLALRPRAPSGQSSGTECGGNIHGGYRRGNCGCRSACQNAAQQAELRQLCHLTLHAVFLIVKPPAGTELHLARHPFALEVADHGAQYFVIARVQQ